MMANVRRFWISRVIFTGPHTIAQHRLRTRGENCSADSGAGLCTKSGQFSVAQVSNLLYRRFPIGRALPARLRSVYRGVRRLEALRYSRLETCATNGSTAVDSAAVRWG